VRRRRLIKGHDDESEIGRSAAVDFAEDDDNMSIGMVIMDRDKQMALW
jgi:hypothetical protein